MVTAEAGGVDETWGGEEEKQDGQTVGKYTSVGGTVPSTKQAGQTQDRDNATSLKSLNGRCKAEKETSKDPR